jgi:subtilisin-like proprotein convertase family protein
MAAGRRARFALVSVALALALFALPGAVAAKKGRVDVTNQANLSIPIGTAATAGLAQSTIEVGNAFKGRRVRDVNVTLHIAGTGANSIAGLYSTLTAPNGASTLLHFSLAPGSLLGPLTLDDESPLSLAAGSPQPLAGYLFQPWQNSAQPDGGPLSVMDGGRVKGPWTLSVIDILTAPHTNTLGFWRLEVATGKPLQTKNGRGR